MRQFLPIDKVLLIKRKKDGQVGILDAIDFKTACIDVKYEYRGTWDLNVPLENYELIYSKPTDGGSGR